MVAADADAALAIATEAGFAITAQDIQSMQSSTNLSDEELEGVSGGTMDRDFTFNCITFRCATLDCAA